MPATRRMRASLRAVPCSSPKPHGQGQDAARGPGALRPEEQAQKAGVGGDEEADNGTGADAVLHQSERAAQRGLGELGARHALLAAGEDGHGVRCDLGVVKETLGEGVTGQQGATQGIGSFHRLLTVCAAMTMRGPLGVLPINLIEVTEPG